ncbi:hypothetical protein LshimejAT787_0500440 [Lyophyllum shimeji]|uniref:Uncharacterized protein n=1 Tax=Lyophyllum shimeji TaxID=47721 RepID=A0A9P3PMG9_LYOSH|nr:hypothetical protein LshimejAT787_0500440 [Lyophyllum shimeji]
MTREDSPSSSAKSTSNRTKIRPPKQLAIWPYPRMQNAQCIWRKQATCHFHHPGATVVEPLLTAISHREAPLEPNPYRDARS